MQDQPTTFTGLLIYEFDDLGMDTWGEFERYCYRNQLKNEKDGQKLPRNVRVFTAEADNITLFREKIKVLAECGFSIEIQTGRCACFIFIESMIGSDGRAKKVYHSFIHEHNGEKKRKDLFKRLKERAGDKEVELYDPDTEEYNKDKA